MTGGFKHRDFNYFLNGNNTFLDKAQEPDYNAYVIVVIFSLYLFIYLYFHFIFVVLGVGEVPEPFLDNLLGSLAFRSYSAQNH